jgi:hypothetical protein
VAEVLRRWLGMVVAAAAAAWQQQLRGIGSATYAAMTAVRQRDGGDSSGSMAAVASALIAVAVVQCNSAVVVAAAVPAPAISCRQGEFNNQQGREAATEGLGWAQTGGRWWWYGTGAVERLGWDGAMIERRTFSSGIKDSAATDDDRGATALPTPSSNARAFERHRHADVRAFVLGRA